MGTQPVLKIRQTKNIVFYKDKHMKKKSSGMFLDFIEAVKDFLVVFMKNSSIHGLRYLVCPTLHPIERFIWFIIVASAVWGAATLSLTTWDRFQKNPTVVSMERNYKDWNTSFPSITICPEPKYDEANIEKIIDKELPGIKNKDKVIDFIKELSNATFGKFSNVRTSTDQIKPYQYWKLLWKVVYPFMYNVSNSNIDTYNKTEMNKVFAEAGICYSYNSVSTIYQNPENWENNNFNYVEGLNVFKGSPLDGDIFAQIMNMNSGYGLYILSPEEFPDLSIPQVEGFNNSYKTLDLTALSIVSTKQVESLSIQQRKCRFPHESDLLTSPVYSYNLCRMECRMKECYRLCRCVPHFYRPIDNYPICDLKGMLCLDKYSERLIRMIDPKTSQKVPCDCLQLCNEVNYIVDNDNTMACTLLNTCKIIEKYGCEIHKLWAEAIPSKMRYCFLN